MRVLMLSNRYPPNVSGGAEIAAGDMAVALRRRGHDVRVLTARDPVNGYEDEPWVARRLRKVIDPARGPHGETRSALTRTLAFYRQTHSHRSSRTVSREAARLRPDVLYLWDVSGIGLVSVLRALHSLTLPIVFQLGSYWWQYINAPQTPFSTVRAAWLKKLIIGPVPALRFTSLIATSDTVKRAYVRAGCPPERIEVIDNAVDAGFLRAPGEAPGRHARPVLMYAGRLCAEKGVTVALHSVDQLVHRHGIDVEMRIFGAGDPRYEQRLRELVASRSLERHVVFCGLVPRERLIAAYDEADVVLVPSLWQEPFGLVVLEAMARGAAVVASDAGALAAVVRDGENGRVVPAGDADAMAIAVRELLRDDRERGRLGAAGRRAVEERYTLDVCVSRVERHLERARALDLQESRWTA